MMKENLELVEANIREACAAAGRDRSEVTLIAVSKTNPAERIRVAYDLGVRDFGENKVKEMLGKEPQLPEDIRWHLIGHLQTNKVKFVVGKVDMIESIDSVHLMDAVEKQAAKVGVTQDIMLEVNIGDEESKGGADKSEVLALARHTLECPHLRLRGIMCIPPATASDEENRRYFQETSQLFIDIKGELGDNSTNIDCLSMGMSGDYPLAIEEGSTMVRVGTALFGARPPWHPQG